MVTTVKHADRFMAFSACRATSIPCAREHSLAVSQQPPMADYQCGKGSLRTGAVKRNYKYRAEMPIGKLLISAVYVRSAHNLGSEADRRCCDEKIYGVVMCLQKRVVMHQRFCSRP